MVEYQSEEIFPAPRDRVWKLLMDHVDDGRIVNIHPLIKSQRQVDHTSDSWTLERTIDARGKLLTSRWKLTMRPPEFHRWEVVSGEGPWTDGSYLESTYTEAPGGTSIRSRGDLRIKVLPFFLPQKSTIVRVLDQVENEDRAAVHP